MHVILLLMSYLDTSVAEDIVDADGPTPGSTTKTVDGEHREIVAGNVLPSTLLSGSVTEFDLQCETDADDASQTKRRQDNSTAVVVNSSVDSLSGGALVTTAASSFDSGADTTDTSAVSKTDSAAGNEFCNEKLLPLSKHGKNYNAKARKASHKSCTIN